MYKIIVNCEENDIVDIKCGGPRFLGYDFFVENEPEDFIEFIKNSLKENKQPLLSIYSINEENSKAKIWSKEEILKCIKDGYQ